MKIWVCSDGCYSDYSIKSMHTSKEDADKMTKSYGWDNDPVEWEVDKALPSEVQQGLKHYGFNLDPREGGDAPSIYQTNYQAEDWWSAPSIIDSVRDLTWLRFHGHCWARDKEHAVKIAAERMYKSMAEAQAVGKEVWEL